MGDRDNGLGNTARAPVEVPFVRRLKGLDTTYEPDGAIRAIKQYDGTAVSTLSASLPLVRFDEETSITLSGGSKVRYARLDGDLYVEAPWTAREQSATTDKPILEQDDDFSVPGASPVGFGKPRSRTPSKVTYDDGAARSARVRTVLSGAMTEGGSDVWVRTFGAWHGTTTRNVWLGFDPVCLTAFQYQADGMLDGRGSAHHDPVVSSWDDALDVPRRIVHLLDGVSRLRAVRMPSVGTTQDPTVAFPDLSLLSAFGRKMNEIDAALALCDERAVGSAALSAVNLLRDHSKVVLEPLRDHADASVAEKALNLAADGLMGYWTSVDLPPPDADAPVTALDALQAGPTF